MGYYKLNIKYNNYVLYNTKKTYYVLYIKLLLQSEYTLVYTPVYINVLNYLVIPNCIIFFTILLVLLFYIKHIIIQERENIKWLKMVKITWKNHTTFTCFTWLFTCQYICEDIFLDFSFSWSLDLTNKCTIIQFVGTYSNSVFQFLMEYGFVE